MVNNFLVKKIIILGIVFVTAMLGEAFSITEVELLKKREEIILLLANRVVEEGNFTKADLEQVVMEFEGEKKQRLGILPVVGGCIVFFALAGVVYYKFFNKQVDNSSVPSNSDTAQKEIVSVCEKEANTVAIKTPVILQEQPLRNLNLQEVNNVLVEPSEVTVNQVQIPQTGVLVSEQVIENLQNNENLINQELPNQQQILVPQAGEDRFVGFINSRIVFRPDGYFINTNFSGPGLEQFIQRLAHWLSFDRIGSLNQPLLAIDPVFTYSDLVNVSGGGSQLNEFVDESGYPQVEEIFSDDEEEKQDDELITQSDQESQKNSSSDESESDNESDVPFYQDQSQSDEEDNNSVASQESESIVSDYSDESSLQDSNIQQNNNQNNMLIGSSDQESQESLSSSDESEVNNESDVSSYQVQMQSDLEDNNSIYSQESESIVSDHSNQSFTQYPNIQKDNSVSVQEQIGIVGNNQINQLYTQGSDEDNGNDSSVLSDPLDFLNEEYSPNILNDRLLVQPVVQEKPIMKKVRKKRRTELELLMS